MSRGLSARPHEILDLKIKDIVFKQVNNKQYAEVLVNGKTGTRYLPLIDSLPYVKEWLDEHPQRSNKNAYFICIMHRSNVGGKLTRSGLLHLYTKQYKETYFPMLLKDPAISKEDKNKIEELLKMVVIMELTPIKFSANRKNRFRGGIFSSCSVGQF